MPLPTSGQISINDLRNEFGNTPGDDRLSEYYRGGSYVSWNNSNVPTSGQISLNDFRGAQNGYLLTQGSSTTGGGSYRGYDTTLSNIGSIYQTTWNGISIRAVRLGVFNFKGSTIRSFSIIMQGTRARNTFSRYYDTSFGNLYTSSSTAFSAQSASTTWTWVMSNNGQYDGSGTIRFYLYP